ncbi:MAG: hypothetical protein ABI903_00575 [Actinomycetota bacterium]
MAAPPQDASGHATRLKGKIPSGVKVVTITENNDGNNLIGRPGSEQVRPASLLLGVAGP